MEFVRTPDAAFEDLVDYPFEPNYAEVPSGDGESLRMHYVDEGPRDGDVVLLMHGEPSWSYLYRHMIQMLSSAGKRVIAPDLIGFGRSDKPTSQDDYSCAAQVAWTSSLLFDHLDLNNITFFGQDWGGLIGLRLVAAQPERYSGVVVGNTGMPTGAGEPSEAFLAWQKFAKETPEFPIGAILNGATVRDLTAEEIAAYDAPFPDDTYTAGARIFPALVPTSTDDPASADNFAAWEALERFEKPFLTTFSDGDPITKGGEAPFQQKVPGAADQNHVTIENAGHFLQEDASPQLAAILTGFMA